ncbi:Hypothetical protein HVR_LOCUS1283 [uncultured virus]|nr:Hypothetical protein HVR_LOCUS1283 [uncultured virus]
MEKLKDPAMLLAVANSIGIVGTTAYFYKQLEALRLDLIKISQTLTGVVRKIGEIEKGQQHNSEALHTFNDQIKTINQRLTEIPSLEGIDELDLDIDELVAALSEHDIHVERPSQVPRRRSGDRRAPPPRRVDDEDRREISSRKPTGRPLSNSTYGSTDRTRDDRSSRTSARDSRDVRDNRDARDTRPTNRGDNRSGQRDNVSQDIRTEPASNYDDDDTSLIDQVRRQQTRN